MKKTNPAIKNILSAVYVIVFGFLMLNITFIIYSLFQGLLREYAKIVIKSDPHASFLWLPQILHGLFIILVVVISWIVFHSRLKDLYKAIYMTAPLAVVFATIGIFFYQSLIMEYILGGLFFICVLGYLYNTKQTWIYYYTLILTTIVMLLMMQFRIEI